MKFENVRTLESKSELLRLLPDSLAALGSRGWDLFTASARRHGVAICDVLFVVKPASSIAPCTDSHLLLTLLTLESPSDPFLLPAPPPRGHITYHLVLNDIGTSGLSSEVPQLLRSERRVTKASFLLVWAEHFYMY